MKKSNIALLVLAGLFLIALLGNTWYHRVKLDERRLEFERMMAYRNNVPKVKVVWSTGAEINADRGYTLHNDVYEHYLNGSDSQYSRFYKSYRIKGDTLFVCLKDVSLDNKKLEVLLPNVEFIYQNGKLIRDF